MKLANLKSWTELLVPHYRKHLLDIIDISLLGKSKDEFVENFKRNILSQLCLILKVAQCNFFLVYKNKIHKLRYINMNKQRHKYNYVDYFGLNVYGILGIHN